MINGPVKELTEELLNAHANLKKAKSLLWEAERSLTKQYFASRSQPNEMLVFTSKGWILLKFNSVGFIEFKEFGDYVIP